MLVRDGRRGSYLAGGILQILLAVLFGFCLLPFTLLAFGVDVVSWLSILTDMGQAWQVILIYGTNAILIVLFLINFFALFVHRSASSTFLKLSTLLPIAAFAAVGLDVVISSISGNAMLSISLFASEVFPYIMLAVAIVSLLFLLVGIIAIFKNRNNPNRATTYQVMKAILWLVFFVFSFVLPFFWAGMSPTMNALFGYTLSYPSFFAWYFLIAGIWQLCSSRKWALPIDPSNGGYPMPPYGYMPPPFYPVYPPQPAPYYPPQGWQPPQGGGYKQGLAEGETTPGVVDTGLEEAVMAIETEKAVQSQQKKLLKEQKKLEKKTAKEKKKQRAAMTAEPIAQTEREVTPAVEPQPAFSPELPAALKTKSQTAEASAKQSNKATANKTRTTAKAEVQSAQTAAKKTPAKSTSKAAPIKKTSTTQKAAAVGPAAKGMPVTKPKIPPFPPAKAPASIMKKKETKKEG